MNREDLDQTPRSVAADLGLHCLPMSLLWDKRHDRGERGMTYIHGQKLRTTSHSF